jgi:hypothetical protein
VTAGSVSDLDHAMAGELGNNEAAPITVSGKVQRLTFRDGNGIAFKMNLSKPHLSAQHSAPQ